MRISANRGLAIAVGVIALAAIIAVNLSSSWRVTQRDPHSPAGVVQQYVTAVFEHRGAAAAALLDGSNGCTAANFDQVYYDQSSRVDLVETTQSGERATVHARIEHAAGDPFGGTWTEQQFFELVKVGSDWRITGNPWPAWNCPAQVKR
jgi:hypothetical protein